MHFSVSWLLPGSFWFITPGYAKNAPLIKESVVICQLPLKKADQIDFEGKGKGKGQVFATVLLT